MFQVGVKYSMCDIICDVINYCVWNLRYG